MLPTNILFSGSQKAAPAEEYVRQKDGTLKHANWFMTVAFSIGGMIT
jgi:hypothetical protein